MKKVEMAVVVSAKADEEKKFADRGFDIKSHRQRMELVDAEGHDVKYNFKDPNHPLQLVFVCAMWQAETQKAKLAAKRLLRRVCEEHPRVLVEDWFKDAHTRRIVRTVVEEVLDAELPDTYDQPVFRAKCDTVFDTILDYVIQGVKFAA